jgi:hypothetical protein
MDNFKDVEKNEEEIEILEIKPSHVLQSPPRLPSSSSIRSIEKPFQRDAYQNQQIKLQRQQTQRFMNNLDSISPVTEETNIIGFAEPQTVAMVGFVSSNKKSSTKESNVRDIYDELVASLP